MRLTPKIGDLCDELLPVMSELRMLANPHLPLIMTWQPAEVQARNEKLFDEWWTKHSDLTEHAIEGIELLLELAKDITVGGTACAEWIERNTTSLGQEENPLDERLIGRAIVEIVAIGKIARTWSEARAPTKETPAKGTALSKEAKALAALTDHPDWTDQQVADAAGCNRPSLYRMQKFVAAKALLKAGREDLPRGRKNADTGDVEAWDDDE